MTRDYYGRIIGMPIDHPDQPDNDELDDDVIGDDQESPIEAASNDAHDWPDWDHGRAAAAAEDRWIADRDRTASQ